MFNIKQLHTDAWNAYNVIPKKFNRTTTKDQTCQVESFNNVLRHYIPRFKRKTHNYSKDKDMIINVLTIFIFLYNKKLLKRLDFINYFNTFDTSIREEGLLLN